MSDSEIDLHGKLTCVDDSIHKDVAWDESVVVLVHLPEQVCQPGLLVVHELEETLPPVIPAELTHALQVKQVQAVVVQTSLPFPAQHPNVTPLVPQEVRTRRPELHVLCVAAKESLS